MPLPVRGGGSVGEWARSWKRREGGDGGERETRAAEDSWYRLAFSREGGHEAAAAMVIPGEMASSALVAGSVCAVVAAGRRMVAVEAAAKRRRR